MGVTAVEIRRAKSLLSSPSKSMTKFVKWFLDTWHHQPIFIQTFLISKLISLINHGWSVSDDDDDDTKTNLTIIVFRVMRDVPNKKVKWVLSELSAVITSDTIDKSFSSTWRFLQFIHSKSDNIISAAHSQVQSHTSKYGNGINIYYHIFSSMQSILMLSCLRFLLSIHIKKKLTSQYTHANECRVPILMLNSTWMTTALSSGTWHGKLLLIIVRCFHLSLNHKHSFTGK